MNTTITTTNYASYLLRWAERVKREGYFDDVFPTPDTEVLGSQLERRATDAIAAWAGTAAAPRELDATMVYAYASVAGEMGGRAA